MLILHGENQIASRLALSDQLLSAKKLGLQIVALKGSETTIGNLVTSTQSMSLLGPVNFVIIEDLFTRRPSGEKTQVIDYLLRPPYENLLIWESKDVTAQLKNFDKSLIKLFTYPKHIFDFLDTFSIQSFQKSVSTSPVEQVFSSLITRIHNILSDTRPPPSHLNTKNLLVAYADLLDLEYKFKTGNSPQDFKAAIELWLIKVNNNS